MDESTTGDGKNVTSENLPPTQYEHAQIFHETTQAKIETVTPKVPADAIYRPVSRTTAGSSSIHINVREVKKSSIRHEIKRMLDE